MNHNHINISDWETISSAHVDDGNFGQYLKLFGDFFCMYIIGIHTKFYGNSSKIECFIGQKPRPPPAMALTVHGPTASTVIPIHQLYHKLILIYMVQPLQHSDMSSSDYDQPIEE